MSMFRVTNLTAPGSECNLTCAGSHDLSSIVARAKKLSVLGSEGCLCGGCPPEAGMHMAFSTCTHDVAAKPGNHIQLQGLKPANQRHLQAMG
jgi:hypothetical protein